jgi:hypothetical protein
MEALEGIGHFEMGAYIEPLKRAVGWVVGQWK